MHMTWAYNRHCHHCGLDMRAYKVRRYLHSARYVVGALLALSAFAWSKRSEAAPQDIEIVRIDPKAPRVPAPGKLRDKAAAEAFARDLLALRTGIWTSLQSDAASSEMNKRAVQLVQRAKVIFGEPGMGDPFRSCTSAASSTQMAVSEAASLVRKGTAEANQVATIVRWSASMGDEYRQCRTEIDAAQ